MKQYVNTTDFYINEATVLTIGKFDGEHIGHRKLLAVMKNIALKKGLKTAVFTFNTAPYEIVGGFRNKYYADKQLQNAEQYTGQITTNDERNKMLEEAGIDYLIEYPFNKEVSHIGGEDFIMNILIEKMHMKAIVAGPDCAFGHNKEGNADLLKEVAKKLPEESSYDVIIIEKLKDENNRDISSTFIRAELDSGNIEKANRLLGSNYSIHGRVVQGNMIGGKILGFPTVNIIPPKNKHLPRFGVYASKVRIIKTGEEYQGLTNVGINPTVDNDKKKHCPRVETYIYDFDRNIYGSDIEISFIKFIRPERKFSSLDDLKKQISSDKEAVKTYFRSIEYV
ncbi:riboflavin biosynthesis protein RibF [Johnsonella ignava ATCC 51276]|uniref:Riboflavin biosynthesis protein n=1 Tax=Johnsonella ignava ATCC 51276 TaxID=679200 RepID=G5GHH6_9FIRM|nr:bifunctional riboflavin kinase/FAD synthetase [Johnsonella ignava]EHI55801.1 riboflavin biosynthesis protein RibF [Johnsonella ignava ATCC 51276]